MKYVIVVTELGRVIKFSTQDLPVQKRGGIGIRGITIGPNDKVAGIITVEE